MWQQCETELSTTACHTAELESQKWAAEVSRLQSGAAQAKRAVEAQQARADGALRQLQSSTAAVRDWQRRAVEAERQVSVLGTRLETLQTPQRQQSPHKNVSRNSSNSSSSSTRSSNVRRRRSTSGGHCGSDCAGGSKAAAFGTDGRQGTSVARPAPRRRPSPLPPRRRRRRRSRRPPRASAPFSS